MRKRSGANFDELLNKEWSVLTKNEHHQIQNLYKKTEQRNGGISFYDMINILKAIGVPISEKRKDTIKKQIADKQIRVLDMIVILNYAAQLKKQKQENNQKDDTQDSQYLDAFVALGGNRDKNGSVTKKTLIQTIKSQFELTFDIDALIDTFPGDSLDYYSFCEIFEQDKERGDGSLASAASQRSLRSSDSMKSLVIDQRDFQKFIAQYQSEQMYSL